MNALIDDSLMPFGKHKGKKMMHVPVDYLHWLWHNGMNNKVNTDPVAAYIHNNLSVLKEENEDLIWS